MLILKTTPFGVTTPNFVYALIDIGTDEHIIDIFAKVQYVRGGQNIKYKRLR